MKVPASRQLIIGALAVVVVIAISIAIGAALLADRQEPAVIQAMGCQDIVAGCSGDGLAVRVSRLPRVMQPFKLEVDALDAESVEATFNMAGMDMGFNRYRLVKQDESKWEAEVTLPVCVRDRKDWLLLLDITQSDQRRRVAIAFTAG